MAKRSFDDILASVAAATVWLRQKRGQGVLMEGGHVVTASHCLPLRWASTVGSGRASDFHIYFDFITAQGNKLKATASAVEVVADVALLTAPDGQSYPEGAKAYEEWRKLIQPVRLFRARFSKFPAEFPVHIRTHKKTWIAGKATLFHDCQSTVWIETEEGLIGGTSGGPIVTDAGELVGVVSWSGGVRGEKQQNGMHPLLRWALPAWLYRDISTMKGA